MAEGYATPSAPSTRPTTSSSSGRTTRRARRRPHHRAGREAETAPNPYLGCGTYLFSPDIFADAHETPRSARTGRLELTDIIDHAARRGAPVLPFVLTGHYLNVNSIEDLNVANFLARALHFDTTRG